MLRILSHHNKLKEYLFYEELENKMNNIQNDEVYCSEVESFCYLVVDAKYNINKNTLIFEEYEEKISKLKNYQFKKMILRQI